MAAPDWKTWKKTRSEVTEELSRFGNATTGGLVTVPQVLLLEAERTIIEGNQYMELLELFAQETEKQYQKIVTLLREETDLRPSVILHL